MKAKIETKYGTMLAELYEKDAPNTVNNFVKLAKEGYYKENPDAHMQETGRPLAGTEGN